MEFGCTTVKIKGALLSNWLKDHGSSVEKLENVLASIINGDASGNQNCEKISGYKNVTEALLKMLDNEEYLHQGDEYKELSRFVSEHEEGIANETSMSVYSVTQYESDTIVCLLKANQYYVSLSSVDVDADSDDFEEILDIMSDLNMSDDIFDWTPDQIEKLIIKWDEKMDEEFDLDDEEYDE